jgi:hypothetical protein
MRAARLGLLAALAALGCGGDFDPPSYLKDLRVLAVLADPLQAGPGDLVTLRPVIYVPPATAVTAIEWRFCPLTLGPAQAFACAVPACDVPLPAAADGSVTAEPAALAAACVATLGPGTGAEAASLPAMVDTAFTLRVAAADGTVRDVVERYPLWPFGAPAESNRAPVITGVTVGGAAPDAAGAFPAVAAGAEAEVAVAIDPASLDVVLEANGATHTEDPVISFFASSGRFADDRANGTLGAATWRAAPLAPEDVVALLYVVARDLRGGQAVAGPFPLPIAR